MSAHDPQIAYLFTRFPVSTETFLQREVAAMLSLGARLRLYSLWGGGTSYLGEPIRRMAAWGWLALVWRIPAEVWRRPAVLGDLRRWLASGRFRSWVNLGENLLGAAFAVRFARVFRASPPDLVHAVWSGAPASAAWWLQQLTGIPYTLGAHAYDLYEDGGDGWLRLKLAGAQWVHTSTDMAAATVRQHGVPPERVGVIRRGLLTLPRCKPLRRQRDSLRVVCIARLVEKKGLFHQLRIYQAARAQKLPFEARILGGGPLRERLERERARLQLDDLVSLEGERPQAEVVRALEWADVLLHTGVVAESGDRDGLPNAVAEAMAAGVVVISSSAGGAAEAIRHQQTGLLADPGESAEWVSWLNRLREDDALAEQLRSEARRWVEEQFDANRNTAALLQEFRRVAGGRGKRIIA